MPKSIPQLGDSNWGTPLNAHISQLQNPANGAINSFEQFSGRPINLTLDDAGKTYLYTQTGNIHQWTGNSWKVLNESVINVKDYGAVGDGVVDDTAVVQLLLDSTTIDKNKSLFFPEGKYLLNVVLKYYVPNMVGQGNHSTILSSFTPTGFAITITRNDSWLPFEISNLRIEGNATKTKNGISFGNSTYGNVDEYAGGLRLISVEMSSLDVAVLKRYGNIGNYFESCRFWNSNYHYKAYSFPKTPENYSNHCGCDTFFKCEFESAIKAAVFINGKNFGDNGQNIFRDCVFQNNDGFAFCVIDYVGITRPNVVIDNVWIENNAQTVALNNANAPAIDIDGIMRIPRTFLFVNSTSTIQNTMITDIELKSSQVIATGVGLGQVTPLNIIKDSNSFLQFENSNSASDVNFFSKNHFYAGSNAYHESIPRLSISKSNDNLIYSNSFSNIDTFALTNNSGSTLATVGQSVQDGTLYDRSIEVDFNSSNNTIVEGFVGISENIILPIKKYIFCSVDVKNINGSGVIFRLNAGLNLWFSRGIRIKKTNWTTYTILGNTLDQTSPVQTALNFIINNNSTKFRIANFQILAFDSLQELMEYSQSLQFRINKASSVSYRSGVPTSGTWSKGDLIYNTNPTAGGYVGWICTVSGTPGTWKGFGLIAV
jgi:Pectate lyase superfamily protein